MHSLVGAGLATWRHLPRFGRGLRGIALVGGEFRGVERIPLVVRIAPKELREPLAKVLVRVRIQASPPELDQGAQVRQCDPDRDAEIPLMYKGAE